MAGRFPLYTDADIRGQLIEALEQKGWDVLRAIDVHPERTKDPVHFGEAAKRGRVPVSYDVDQVKIALEWLSQGRRFPGLLTWPQRHHQEWSDGQIAEGFEALAAEEDPFSRGLSDQVPEALIRARLGLVRPPPDGRLLRDRSGRVRVAPGCCLLRAGDPPVQVGDAAGGERDPTRLCGPEHVPDDEIASHLVSPDQVRLAIAAEIRDRRDRPARVGTARASPRLRLRESAELSVAPLDRPWPWSAAKSP